MGGRCRPGGFDQAKRVQDLAAGAEARPASGRESLVCLLQYNVPTTSWPVCLTGSNKALAADRLVANPGAKLETVDDRSAESRQVPLAVRNKGIT